MEGGGPTTDPAGPASAKAAAETAGELPPLLPEEDGLIASLTIRISCISMFSVSACLEAADVPPARLEGLLLSLPGDKGVIAPHSLTAASRDLRGGPPGDVGRLPNLSPEEE